MTKLSKYCKYSFFWILIFLSLCISDSFAQENYQDVLYFKNGKILKGKIQSIENQRINFISDTGTVVVLSMEDISKIRKERGSSRMGSAKDTVFKAKGFLTVVELGYAKGTGTISTRIGSFKNTQQAYCLSISHGYLVAPTFYIGLGAGYDRYEFFKFVPLFLDLRSDFFRERWRPLFRLKMGHSFGWRDNDSASDWAGFMVQADLGVKLMLSHSRALHVSLGLKSQQVKVTYSIFRNNAPPLFNFERLGHQFFCINAGFSF